MSDLIAVGMIVGGMALSWLYALGIERSMGDLPEKAKP